MSSLFKIGNGLKKIVIRMKVRLKEMRVISPWIQTTNNCNLSCPYCYVKQNSMNMLKEVYQKINEKLIDLIKNNELDFVGLRLAGGEPLLVFDEWKNHTDYFLDNVGCNGSVELLTNLTIIPKGFFEYLSKINLSVSLDGVNNSKPFKNHSSSSKIVMKNIEEIKKHKKICIMTVINDNGNELPQLAEYVCENKFPWQISLNKYFENHLDIDLIKQNIQNTLDILHNNNYPILGSLKINNCSFMGEPGGCKAGNELIYINTNGDIYPCQTLDGKKPIGNVFEESSIVNMIKAQKIYDLTSNMKCQGCDIFSVCAGDCLFHNDNRRKEYFCNIMSFVTYYMSKLILIQRKEKVYA